MQTLISLLLFSGLTKTDYYYSSYLICVTCIAITAKLAILQPLVMDQTMDKGEYPLDRSMAN